MGCIEHKKSPATGDTGQDYNPYDVMEPRLPGKTPVDRRNGKHVKANDIPPEGVYLPNNNILAPHMKSPEYVQLSNAAAITLGIMGGRMYRCECTRCLNLLLTYPEGCRANCAYCGLARHREAERDYADRNFIRVDWPAVPMRQWTDKIDPDAIPVSILSNPTTMTRDDVQRTKDLGADIFTVALDAATPELFDRTRGKGVQSPHKWKKYWDIMLEARDIFGPQKFGAHIIVGMGETEYEVLKLVQELVDLGGHSHMFCFFPEDGSLMDHLPATPRDQWRRVQLARYLIDYRDVHVDHMSFDEEGRVKSYGIADSELADVIDAGIAFRTSGCPGKFQDDISACDRPYGDSPPSNIASYPFQPKKKDIKKIRKQLDIPVAVK
jgi:biotin synthase